MIVKYNSKERELLARIMRAEAVGEGNLGMLMVGNVVINRVLANCLTFKNVTTITDVLYQANQYYYPATNALWFYAPSTNESCKITWYDQDLAGRYKSHCFYNPDPGVCEQIH